MIVGIAKSMNETRIEEGWFQSPGLVLEHPWLWYPNIMQSAAGNHILTPGSWEESVRKRKGGERKNKGKGELATPVLSRVMHTYTWYHTKAYIPH